MPYWILAEDLAAAAVGPFETENEARRHIVFCRNRGDGATMRVTDRESEVKEFSPHYLLTPEQDRNFDPATWRKKEDEGAE